ncbi:hypothetical protein PVAND_016549 [Polypedilum vanderplanki]|uniref:Cell cycle control protein 50A n=1 Tax=Polypedilum vanderplanki TaxID=319348 RepID=A0A9J6BFR3_POLVA|nr:hypothetical protein PVAND_016549 [Polypedilum vanderplanki]
MSNCQTDQIGNEQEEKPIKKEKSKRPVDSDFKQQKLKPLNIPISHKAILSSFFVFGIILIGAGVILKISSGRIKEIKLSYTNCFNYTEDQNAKPTKCADLVTSRYYIPNSCRCQYFFTIEKPLKGKVFIYYKLTNFYHNHRAFKSSIAANQFLGDLENVSEGECKNFHLHPVTNVTIVPCGAIANSFFNDSMKLSYVGANNDLIEVPMLKTGIALNYEKETKFFNPTGLKEALRSYSKPLTWQRNLMELDQQNEDNNGFQNEDFIVWMRGEALKKFRKLYRKVDHGSGNFLFENGLPNGTYVAEISYNYPVVSFSGTKTFIITTSSILGGKNNSIGYMYIVVGSSVFIIGIYMLITFLRNEGNGKID